KGCKNLQHHNTKKQGSSVYADHFRMVCVLIYNRMREKLKYTPEFNKLSIKEQALLDKLTDAIWKFVRKTPKLNQVSSKTRDAHASTYAISQGKSLVDKAFEQL